LNSTCNIYAQKLYHAGFTKVQQPNNNNPTTTTDSKVDNHNNNMIQYMSKPSLNNNNDNKQQQHHEPQRVQRQRQHSAGVDDNIYFTEMVLTYERNMG